MSGVKNEGTARTSCVNPVQDGESSENEASLSIRERCGVSVEDGIFYA